VRVTAGELPTTATSADVASYTAWLHRQIVFEQESLAAVAAEFNRYSALPIEIETPALRTLLISGVFATDDPESFIAFLRTLDGVTVETTPTRIRVLAGTPATPVKPPRAN
jgi:transmembrane sensor